MSGYKPYPPAGPLLIGYDPYRDLPADHLAWLVDEMVDEWVKPAPKASGAGQPERDPRVCIKVVLYSCMTGVHSSRRMAQNCYESLPYLLLVREDRPCHMSLADARRFESELLRELFCRLKQVARELGIAFLGRIAIDSSKFPAIASKDSVVAAKDYDQALAAFDAILSLVEKTDLHEDAEGSQVHVQTGVSRIQMREVLRSVGKESTEDLKLSPAMVKRVKAGVKTLEKAKAEGASHVSLTDPDARIMPIGSSKKQRMGYQFEAVTDGGNLLETSTGNHASDGGRLLPLVEAAREASDIPITQVTADTGYFSGGQVQELLDSGTDVLVPDRAAAREMRLGPPPPEEDCITFKKIEGRNAYICPRGNVLIYAKAEKSGGQRFITYIAKDECSGCPLASRCLKKPGAKRRYLRVGEFRDSLKTYSAKFAEPENRKAYMARGPAIETVFAVIQSVFGFHRWHVIGAEAVACEGMLLSCAYELKKIQVHLRKLGKTFQEAMA